MSEQLTNLQSLLRFAGLGRGGSYAVTRALTNIRLYVAQANRNDPIAIIYVLEGQANVQWKKMIVDVRKGDMVVVLLEQGKTLDFASAESVCILIEGNHALFAEVKKLDLEVVSSMSVPREITSEYFDAMAQMLAPAARSDQTSLLDRLLDVVLRSYAGKDVGMQNASARISRLIRSDLCNPDLSLAMLSKRLGLSRTSIYRAMNASGGVAKHILRLRLEEALICLATTTYRHGIVNDVSRKLCFKNPAHFSRAFSRQFGRTPGEVHALANQRIQTESFVQYIARRDGVDTTMILEWLNKNKA